MQLIRNHNLETLFSPSHNCWQIADTDRAAFIIDGAAYFKALHEAMQQARRSIFIIGWDLHSELQLLRNGEATLYPTRLGAFLDALVQKHKQLNIYLLSWDFAMIYAMEREFFPRYKLQWRTHNRIHFYLDGAHPIGASQHQKIVVIDDAVAFSGGLDLSKWRWDTPAHQPADERRVAPDGKPYPPFHDVQMIVDGQAAKALAELVKQRWEIACGQMPCTDQHTTVGDPWPSSVKPEFQAIQVAIARTLPTYRNRAEVREVEQLYLDSIATAREFIYIENQYLSSYRIGEALKARLEEADGPEIVIVMPQKTGGWLEQHTMDVLRGRILRKLRKADRNGKLRTYYPRLAVNPEIVLMVHAKVMIIDNHFMRIGSSNLSNRSLGLDSECDLAVSAKPGSAEERTIRSFRDRLVAEHLGVPEERIAQAYTEQGSLIAAIESLHKGERTLVHLDGEVAPEIDQWVPDAELLDPEKPIDPDELLDYFISPQHQYSATRHGLKIILSVAAFLALAALWRWTPLSEWLNIDAVTAVAAWIERHPLTPLLVPTAYVLGGLVSFPVTLMIIATVIIFGPWWGLFYALLSSQLSALVMFLLGRCLGGETVSRFAGGLLNRLNQRLSRSGLLAVITLRIIPVAPFSVINIIAGVSAISLRDFALGSLIGMIPGTVAIVMVADRMAESLQRPDLASFAALLAAIAIAGAGLFGLRQWLSRRQRKKQKTSTAS